MSPSPTLADIRADAALNGIYALAPEVYPADAGIVAFSGDQLAGRQAILDNLARGLGFPDYYGRNWDALEECLGDLELGEGGMAVLVDQADLARAADPESWNILLDILAAAAEDRRQAGEPFAVFLRGDAADYPLVCA